MTNPVEFLEGKDLGNGWTVGPKVTRKQHSTGGHFSVGYHVYHESGAKAFLKALDFSAAAQSPDPAREFQKMTEIFNYERDLLNKCKSNNLRRVMIPIIDGNTNIDGFGNYSTVHYLIFELADGDIRDAFEKIDKVDILWRLRSLHHVAIGLSQLHGINIAHQDIKPSNVLVLNDGSKIGDLGRSEDQAQPSPNSGVKIAGDFGYAPIDLLYPDSGVTGVEKKFLTDLYLFGSLFFFHFSGVSACHALRSKLQGQPLSNQSFQSDLPYIQKAFEETLIDLKVELRKFTTEFDEEIIGMVRQLCEPDPQKRGDPKWKMTLVPTYDLQRYISKLDLLYRKVQASLR